MSRQSFQRTYYSQEELGAYAAGKDYWFDNNSANFTTPDDQLAPAIVLSIGAADPGLPVWAALVSYEVTYHLRFFNVRAETVAQIKTNYYLNGVARFDQELEDWDESSVENKPPSTKHSFVKPSKDESSMDEKPQTANNAVSKSKLTNRR